MKNKITVHDVATYGVYTAIFLIMGLVPNMGYINAGPVVITLMPLPVAIVTLHKKYVGAVFGTFMFGLTSIMNLPIIGGQIIAIMGWAGAYLSFFCGRIMILLPIFIYFYVTKNMKMNRYINGIIVTAIITMFNTIFVFGWYVILNYQSTTFWGWFALSGITNILPEWTILPVLGGLLSRVSYVLANKDKARKEIVY